ncbi:cytochrome P450 [Sparassis latifolia]
MDYRTRFFLGLLESLFPPFITTYILLSVARHARFDALAVVIYVLSPCVWISLKAWYTTWTNDRRARQLGARIIPRARGKWPGNIDIMFRFARDLRHGYVLESMGNLLDEYGCDTLNTRILWKDNFLTRDNLHMQAMHSTNFDLFERGPEQFHTMGTFLGRGIFVTDGLPWKKNRALIRPFLSRERVSDFEILAKHAEKTLAILADAAESQQPIDLQDLFLRFTLDAGAEFILGFYPDSLSGPRPVPYKARIGAKGSTIDDEFGTFAQAFEEVQVTISMRWRLNAFWPLYELFGDRTLPSVNTIMMWVKPIVTKALEGKKRADEQGATLNREERTLLDSLVESTDDEETVRYGLLNVMMAARDTTAGLLTYAMYFLTQHPNVTKRLLDEVIAVCGPFGNPTQATIRKLTYMTAVLNETLRLYPGAPLGIRHSIKEVLLPSSDGGPPLYLPAKSRMTWMTLHLHRRKDLWGEDSETFDPERWLDLKRIAHYQQDPSVFVPFLSGPRMCPGQAFALTEASFMLCKLLQRFSKFELVPEAIPRGAEPPEAWKAGKGRKAFEKIWPGTAFTIYVKGGMWARLGR